MKDVEQTATRPTLTPAIYSIPHPCYINVQEMKYLRSLIEGSKIDKVRNEEVRRSVGIEMEMASRVDQRDWC